MATMEPDEKSLSAPEICAILKACSETKVQVLKYRGLFLRFGPSAQELRVSPLSTASATEIAAIQTSVAEKIKVLEDIRAGETRVEDLLIEDPARYEAMIASGELNPDGSQPDPDDIDD